MDPSDGVGWVHLQTLVYPPIINPLGYIWRPRKPKIVPDRFSPKLNPNPYMWAKSTARKIVCIGRNYAEHAKELGNKVPTTPMIFLKPTSSIISQPNPIELPKLSVVHHELELGVVIGKDGRDIAVEQAWDYVKGYSLCLDMTARNFQDEAKKNGHPWTLAKGFDTFTPVGDFIQKSEIKDPSDLNLVLNVDGRVAQNGNTRDMIFKIPELISYISQIMTLNNGDLILTGTPAGVGPVKAGQTLVGRLLSNKQIISTFAFPVIDRK